MTKNKKQIYKEIRSSQNEYLVDLLYVYFDDIRVYKVLKDNLDEMKSFKGETEKEFDNYLNEIESIIKQYRHFRFKIYMVNTFIKKLRRNKETLLLDFMQNVYFHHIGIDKTMDLMDISEEEFNLLNRRLIIKFNQHIRRKHLNSEVKVDV